IAPVASLAGLGKRILTGLTPALQQTLIRVAHGESQDAAAPEVTELVTLGALSVQPPAGRKKKRVTVAGASLAEMLRNVTEPEPGQPPSRANLSRAKA